MEFKQITIICFSPTETTKAIAKNIAQGTGIIDIQMIDITLPGQREIKLPTFSNEPLIIAVPVYYGRVPELVYPWIKSLKGHNTPVIPVVVYGNREFEDALIELSDILVEGRFVPVAAGAFIGEHSYSRLDRKIAHDRPDTSDITQAHNFGLKLIEKISSHESIHDLKNLTLPGNKPYIEPIELNMIKQVRKEPPSSLTPETDTSYCTECGTCAAVCPTGAIDLDDISKVDKHKCIICFACIKKCTVEAKAMNEPNFNNAIENLKEKCKERKEPEIFI